MIREETNETWEARLYIVVIRVVGDLQDVKVRILVLSFGVAVSQTVGSFVGPCYRRDLFVEVRTAGPWF